MLLSQKRQQKSHNAIVSRKSRQWLPWFQTPVILPSVNRRYYSENSRNLLTCCSKMDNRGLEMRQTKVKTTVAPKSRPKAANCCKFAPRPVRTKAVTDVKYYVMSPRRRCLLTSPKAIRCLQRRRRPADDALLCTYA